MGAKAMSMTPAPLVTPERMTLLLSLLLAAGVPLWLLWPRQTPSEQDLPLSMVTPVRLFEAAEPAEALAAPLFNPDRVPPTQMQESEPVSGQPPADTVPVPVGLVTGRKTGGLALLRVASGETLIARIGEVVDGWTVIAITSSAVSLRRGDDERRLELNYDNREAQAETPPVPSSQMTGR